MSTTLHILLVEDAVADAELAQREIRKAVKDCDFQRVDSRKDFLEALETFQPDVILSDYNMPNFDGLKALELALELAPLTPFIIWTGSVSEEAAVECMKAGATNYIIKENIQRLGPAVIHALGERRLKLEAVQAEVKLRESEKRFRSLIENSLDNISLLTREGMLLWENPAVNRTLGYGQDMFVGRNMFELMHPEDVVWTQKRFTDLLKYPGKHENGTFRLRHVNGTWRWIEAIATNLLDDPSVQAIVINYRDITEREEAEIELQKKNDDLALLNAINEAVIRDENLTSIMDLLNEELKRIFSCEGSTIYMLDPQEQSLTMQQYKLLPAITKKIEGLIGGTIPLVRIPVRDGGHFQKILRSKRGVITSDPHEIQKWMDEFTDSTFLGPAARGVIRKLIPQIYKVLNITSTITVPLVSNEGTIGLMDVSSPGLFTENDLERIESIARQMTAAIQRQQANERVQRSEEFLQSVQNALTSNIAILDKDGVIVRVNSAWRKFGELNGFQHPQQGIGLNYLDVCDSATGPYSDEAPLVAQAIRDVIAGRIPYAEIEYPCHSPKENRWFILRITKFADGEQAWVVLAHENITERKQAENALRESETRYRGIFESVQDAIFVESMDGDILDVNQRACDIFGYTRDEFLKKKVADLVPSREHIIGLPSVNEYSLAQTSETINVRASGEQFPVEIRGGAYEFGDQTAYLVVLRDITERKRAEQALQKSEATLAQAGKMAHLGAWEIAVSNPDDLNSNPLRWSDEVYRIFGYEPGTVEVTNDLFFGHIHPDDRQTVQDAVGRSIAAKKPYDVEHRIVRVDGVERIVEERADLVFEEHGRLVQILGAVQDITERKQAEEELRLSHSLLNAALEATKDGILVVGEDRKVFSFNRKFLELWKIPYSLTKKKDDRALLKFAMGQLKDPHAFITKVEELYQTPEADSFDELEFKDGRIFERHSQPQRLGSAIVGRVWSFRDITERKQAEEKLRSSEERFRQLADNIQEVFWMTDVVSGKEIYISPATEKIWGRSVESMLHVPNAFIEHVLFEDRPTVIHALEEQRNGKNTDMEYRITHADGTVRWIWDRAFPIFDDSGKVIRLAGIAADITDRKQAEDALRESEKRYHGLFDNLVIGFALHEIVVDDDGKPVDYVFLEINPMFEKLTGINASDAIGRRVSEMLPGVENDRFIQIYGMVALSGEPVHLEEYSTVLNKYFEINAYSPRHGQFAVTFTDITERKHAEEEIRRRGDEFAALYETARDLSAAQDLPVLLNMIVERARALLHVEGGGVYLYDPSRGDLEMVLSMNTPIPTGARLRMGEGMAGRVAQTRQPLILDDYQSWEGRSPQYEGVPFRAVIQSPMLYGGDLIGVLVVHEMGASERKFTETDAYLLSLFAEYAAGAVHNTRLFNETQRRAAETAALLKTSQALTGLELETNLQTIGNRAKTLFTADGVRIFLKEPGGETLRCVLALQENTDAFEDLRIKVGEGITGKVAASGQAEIVNDMVHDPRAVQVSGTPEEEEAIMFAPLKERDHTIGVLSVRRVGTQHPFHPADLELLEAFASMAASAVSSARLFEETQRRLAELEALYENGLAVGQLLEPREIGERIIDTFTHHLSWHHVTIRLMKEGSDEFELIAFSQPHMHEGEREDVERNFTNRIHKVGQGMCGWVVQTGEAVRTGDLSVFPQYVGTYEGIQSGLYMPLKIGGRVIGVISVESEKPDAFSAQDERLLATLANQTAIAFENAHLYQSVQQELTERKRMEMALRSSETHYRELADSITDVLFELDQDMRYTHWNKASETLTGVTEKDAIGKRLEEIFDISSEQAHIGAIYESVLTNRRPRTFETIFLLNNEKHSFEVNAYPSTRGVAVVAKDITERKRLELLQQKRFELMEYSAHNTLDDLLCKTMDEISELTGSEIGFFHLFDDDQDTPGEQFWSTETLRRFNVPASEGRHRPVEQAGAWADAVRQRRPLIQNEFESLPHRKGVPQGHARIVREMVIPVIRNEKILAVLGVGNKPQDYTQQDLEIAGRLADYAWDIAERKRMQAALAEERNQLAHRVEERTAELIKANTNLARALRVKDEFLANMSHELRTPLNAILGLSESLGEQVAGPLNEKQLKYITTIGESGHHLLSLINDILDLAKIEAGQITLDINKVDVHAVCQASLRMVKQLAQKKDQEMILHIDANVVLMWADERRLKQMIVNLLSNAVKFTPENGKLGLDVHGYQDENRVEFSVWDNGIGINENDLTQLFQPFVQLDSGLARESTGTGLGLALVSQMARLHGGSVVVLSKPGMGSRFVIKLPWEPALARDTVDRLKTTGKLSLPKTPPVTKKTILLIEDTVDVVMMIQDYLETAGYDVMTAEDGQAGIDHAKLMHPDLILMDIQMPRMDGIEATQKLRADPEFKYTPIIALTALAMPNDRKRCLEAGMDEYISKPVNLRALVKIIEKCLSTGEERTRLI